LRAANLTPATQRAYLDGLTRLARFLTDAGMPTDVAAITREHVEAFITDQLERLSPASAANRYSSLRPFFNWLVEEGGLKASPIARMRKPKVPEHAPPILTDAELAAILRACGSGMHRCASPSTFASIGRAPPVRALNRTPYPRLSRIPE
jgi:site-specific recombinase XerD